MYIENNKIELKRELVNDIKQEIIAFLNSQGGIIYVGVNDDGTLYPPFLMENKDEILLKVSSWIQESFYPLPSNLIVFDYNDDGVLKIEINEGSKKPYYLKDKGPKPSGVYKRVGTSIRKCSEDEILHMIMDSNRYIFEDDISENQDLSFKYFDRVCEEKGIPTTKIQKTNFGMINANGEYTNIGLLMSDNSPIQVKIAEYDDELNFKMKNTFGGSLLKLIDNTQEQAERLNDTSAIIDSKTWKRIETKSYPGNSLREIILNAFCHSDYFIRSNIKIEFYKDKVKITSPGGLYNATVEDILRGVQTYRNPHLVHLLDKMGFIENFKTGIPRTLDAYKNTGVEPKFFNSDNFFIVYLPNLNYQKEKNSSNEEKHRLNRPINCRVNQQSKIIIDDLGLDIIKAIKDSPGIKVPGIFSVLSPKYKNLNLDKIRYSIKTELRDVIELRGSKKTGGYYLKNE